MFKPTRRRKRKPQAEPRTPTLKPASFRHPLEDEARKSEPPAKDDKDQSPEGGASSLLSNDLVDEVFDNVADAAAEAAKGQIPPPAPLPSDLRETSADPAEEPAGLDEAAVPYEQEAPEARSVSDVEAVASPVDERAREEETKQMVDAIVLTLKEDAEFMRRLQSLVDQSEVAALANTDKFVALLNDKLAELLTRNDYHYLKATLQAREGQIVALLKDNGGFVKKVADADSIGVVIRDAVVKALAEDEDIGKRIENAVQAKVPEAPAVDMTTVETTVSNQLDQRLTSDALKPKLADPVREALVELAGDEAFVKAHLTPLVSDTIDVDQDLVRNRTFIASLSRKLAENEKFRKTLAENLLASEEFLPGLSGKLAINTHFVDKLAEALLGQAGTIDRLANVLIKRLGEIAAVKIDQDDEEVDRNELPTFAQLPLLVKQVGDKVDEATPKVAELRAGKIGEAFADYVVREAAPNLDGFLADITDDEKDDSVMAIVYTANEGTARVQDLVSKAMTGRSYGALVTPDTRNSVDAKVQQFLALARTAWEMLQAS